MNEERARRASDNEALYRLVNEQIEGLNETFARVTDEFAVICECGRLDCQDPVAVTRRTYERVRADPARFILKPGHQQDEVEDVVEAGDGYVVVAKKPGTPERRAVETDPRR